ncbi:MAG TPA: hypothetical protein VMH50_14345 [Thermoleophilia bacterium]|nr:hypothetical protein [Thermoleophilia bacterium]
MSVRPKAEIEAAMREVEDRLWFDQSRAADHDEDSQNVALSVMARREAIERLYGKDSLGPMTPFELGRLHGKYSALRWTLGGDWNVLDA